jgi:hypothetical protein
MTQENLQKVNLVLEIKKNEAIIKKNELEVKKLKEEVSMLLEMKPLIKNFIEAAQFLTPVIVKMINEEPCDDETVEEIDEDVFEDDNEVEFEEEVILLKAPATKPYKQTKCEVDAEEKPKIRKSTKANSDVKDSEAYKKWDSVISEFNKYKPEAFDELMCEIEKMVCKQTEETE